jgi:hypothetical protein
MYKYLINKRIFLLDFPYNVCIKNAFTVYKDMCIQSHTQIQIWSLFQPNLVQIYRLFSVLNKHAELMMTSFYDQDLHIKFVWQSKNLHKQ